VDGLAALMTGLIDYAGLFPPAGLGMADAAAAYSRNRGSAHGWVLGRFVVPVNRLEELERAVGPGEAPWDLTALASLPPCDDLVRVASFNDGHARDGVRWGAAIRSVELKAASAGEIARASASIPAGVEAYFEVPGDAGIDQMCRAAAAGGHGLKIRTGGTTLDAFPPSSVVARVMAACAAARVPFKATAGLHHALRAPHPITYEPGAPRATMHGFLNVFVAACLLFAGKADVAVATQVLEDEIATSFRFDAGGLRYRALSLTVAEVTAARRLARSFGSCSFEEPVSDLANL